MKFLVKFRERPRTHLAYPTPPQSGRPQDAARKILELPSQTPLVQRQPNTLEAVWEKPTLKAAALDKYVELSAPDRKSGSGKKQCGLYLSLIHI